MYVSQAGHDKESGSVADHGGIDGLRPYCDSQPWCIGYEVEADVMQVWFKSALDPGHNTKCPGPKGPDWRIQTPPYCPYSPHEGAGTGDAGGLYVKCANKTQPKGFTCAGAAGLYQCVPAASPNGTVYPEKQLCLEHCKAPPPPPPGPPPPAPHYDKP